MFVGLFGKLWVGFLIFVAKCLHFLESKFFDFLLKTLVVLLLVVFAFSNSNKIRDYLFHLNNNIRVYKWYKSLPPNYLLEKEKALDESYKRYQEVLRSKAPRLVKEITPPVLSAKSYLVLDLPSGEILLSKNSKVLLPPASTAKLATALAALRLYSLDDTVYIPQFCTQVASSRTEFTAGQEFLVRDLIKALLIGSSGDAACALSISQTSHVEFVKLMNQVAKEAGLEDTNFTNPVGLDDFDGKNLTTAYDLAFLSAFAMQNEFIREVVSTREFELKDTKGKFVKTIVNTNKFLFELPGSVGIKTGTTAGAGEVLSYAYSKDGVNLIIVVMASQDRFGDVRKLLNWALSSYSWD